jgi:hypothetical protein
MRRLLLLASLFMISLSACKKQDDGFTRAQVIYGGDLTPGGCGWLLRFEDSTLVKPVVLNSSFQYDGLGVLIKYYKTGENTNCVPQHPYAIIGIDEIKRDR